MPVVHLQTNLESRLADLQKPPRNLCRRVSDDAHAANGRDLAALGSHSNDPAGAAQRIRRNTDPAVVLFDENGMNEVISTARERGDPCDDSLYVSQGPLVGASVANDPGPDIHIIAEAGRAEDRANIVKVHIEQQEKTFLHQPFDLPLDGADFAEHPQRGGAERNVVGGF